MPKFTVVAIMSNAANEIVGRETAVWEAASHAEAIHAASGSFKYRAGEEEQLLFYAARAAEDEQVEAIVIDMPRPWWSPELHAAYEARDAGTESEAAFLAKLHAETDARRRELAAAGKSAPQKKGSHK